MNWPFADTGVTSFVVVYAVNAVSGEVETFIEADISTSYIQGCALMSHVTLNRVRLRRNCFRKGFKA